MGDLHGILARGFARDASPRTPMRQT